MLLAISSEKSWWNLSKIVFLGPICPKKGWLWAMPKMKNNLFGRNNKSRSSLFRNFLFYQISFLSNKCNFQLKQPVACLFTCYLIMQCIFSMIDKSNTAFGPSLVSKGILSIILTDSNLLMICQLINLSQPEIFWRQLNL